MKKAKTMPLCGGGGEFLEASPKAPLVEWLKGLRVEGLLKASYTHNCHSGLDPESHQQEPVVFNSPSLRGAVGDEAIQSMLSHLRHWIATPSSPTSTTASTGPSMEAAQPPRNDETLAVIAGETLNQVQGDTKKPTLKLFTASPLKLVAFTMAEILLSLTIIGVVAAITLPSLTGNINERTWETQRKALYSRFSQAMALMPSLNNYGTLDATDSKNVAETFVTSGLAKVLKINNICGYGTDGSSLSDCGIPDTMTNLAGTKMDSVPKTLSELNPKLTAMTRAAYGTTPAASYSQVNIKAVAFETQNGESILAFYNSGCKISSVDIESASAIPMQPYLCANFIYDLNGTKGPNTVGKDIGVITVFNATDSVVVAPNPYNKTVTATDDTATSVCRTELSSDEYRLPNYMEAASLWANRVLFGYSDTEKIYTQTTKIKSDGVHRRLITASGELMSADIGAEAKSLCIKR